MTDGPHLLFTTGARVKVVIGDSITFDVVVYDGQKAGGRPYGARVDISAVTITGDWKIQNPDGSADLTVAASKIDKYSDGYETTFRFTVAKTVTALWTAQNAGMRVKLLDSAGTVEKTIVLGEVEIVADPTAAA